MAPPKPPNPSSKDIIDEAVQQDVQTDHMHLDVAMNETQQQLDDRFEKAATELQQTMGQIHSRLDKDKQLTDSRYDSLMAAITKVTTQQGPQPATSTLTAGSSSGISHPLASTPFTTTTFTHLISPNQTPNRNSTIFTHTTTPPAISATARIPNSQIPFVPYRPNPTLFSASQTYTQPPHTIFQQPTFPQFPNTSPTFPQIPSSSHLPHFRTPRLELDSFDGSNPLEWLFQAEQYFNFYQLTDENRLPLISFYMKGDVLSWFKWMF